VKVFGVSVDGAAANRAFAEKFGYPFPLLCDVDKELSLAYGAVATKEDQYAQRYTFLVGPDATIEHAIETTDPAGQAADLLDILP